jgi:alkylation response protein AidB-like acyl-CoA dehydrogenase
MGMHSSPTGELFLTDVRVGKDRLIGETEEVPAGGREGAKDTFSMERSASPPCRSGSSSVPRALGAVRQGPGAVRQAHR